MAGRSLPVLALLLCVAAFAWLTTATPRTPRPLKEIPKPTRQESHPNDHVPGSAGKGRVLQDCVDVSEWCSYWTEYCSDEYYYDGQSTPNYWCRATCGRCGSTPPDDGGSGSGCDGDGCNAELLDLVNAFRADNGKEPLCLNSVLTAASKQHSDDMNNNNFFSHTGSDGSSHIERAQGQGWGTTWVSENIAQGVPDSTTKSIFDMWVNSEGHRNNILGDYSFMGAYKSGLYWTQMFASDENQSCQG